MKRVFIAKIIVPAIMVIVLFVTLYSMVFLPMVEKGFHGPEKRDDQGINQFGVERY
jgi:hypothetical protein